MKKLRLLIVDDDDCVVELIAALLGDQDFEIEHALDASAAIAKALPA